MKHIIGILFLLLFAVVITNAQQESPQQKRRHFVMLQDGQLIYANKVQFKSPVFKSSHFLLDDSLKYPIEMVNTYQNNDGYFTRISYGGHSDAFAKRILEGPRISKFYSMRSYYDYNMYGFGYGMPRSSRRRIYYFSKDNGPLYELTLNNLEQALADNPSSMALLRQYKRNKLIHTGMSIAGAGLLTYGILTSANNVNSNPNGYGYPSLSPTVFVGGGLIALPFVIQLFQKDKLTQAMEVYNYELKQ